MKRTAIREKFDIEKERLERRKVQTRRKTQFKSSTRAITTMHDSIEEPDDFGFSSSLVPMLTTKSNIDVSVGYYGISDQYKHQLFAVSQFLWG
ncbi:hypothetical protein CRE_31073 [Caenorhabditis remanei]|uniref:Uncharacterized protein n=1 Tax=Caenorhabditis remanei TaxID=31234 RepID=E3LUG4_CAERE|nr:hypothetical protein CRE_31073 [Caenorhabditis remanei]